MSESYNSRHFAIIIGAAITSTLVYYAGSKYGPGLTYDSVNYLYAGHALYEKGRLLRPLENPYIEWPPLYPVIIAGLHFFGNNLLQSVLFFQVIISGITVGMSGYITAKMLNNAVLFYTAFIATVFSTPLILVNHFVWSESLFLLLLVLQIQLFIKYTSQPTQLVWYLLLLDGILLCLQRHTGILFVVAGAGILIIYPAHYTFAKRIARSLLYGLISVLPLVFWWVRNYNIKGLIMNDFRDTLLITPFFKHWSAYTNVFTAWFLPNEFPIGLRGVIIYGILVTLIFMYVRLHKPITSQQKAALVLFVLFITYFVLAFVACFAIGEYIDDRILAPIYIPCILLLSVLLEQYIIEIQAKLKNRILLICFIWLVYPFARSIVNINFWHNLPKQLPAGQPVEEEFRRYILR